MLDEVEQVINDLMEEMGKVADPSPLLKQSYDQVLEKAKIRHEALSVAYACGSARSVSSTASEADKGSHSSKPSIHDDGASTLVKLKPLNLMTFSADVRHFRPFMEQLEASVLKKYWSDQEKFMYFLSVLGGKAAKLVQGYSLRGATHGL